MKKQLTDTEFHYPIRYRMSQTVRYCLAVITKQFSLFQYSATFHLSPYHGGRWNGSHRSRREVKHFSFSLLYVDNRFCEDFTVSENPKTINCSVQSRGQKYIRGRTRVYHNQAGPGYPSALAGREMPGVVGCAASQWCQAAQYPLQTD